MNECGDSDDTKLSLQRSTQALEPQNDKGVPPLVHEVLHAPGQPLDAATRASLEPRFGHDFSQVRVHNDERAGESAHLVHALAYTIGQDIVFAAGQYSPATQSGRHLLAHELAHTIQQRNAQSTGSERLGVSHPGDELERQADAAANFSADSSQALTPNSALQIARRDESSDAGAQAPVAGVDASEGDAGTPDGDAGAPDGGAGAQDGGAAATCPPKERLEAIEKQYRDIVKKGRDKGANVAADNLEHFLAGSGTKRVLSVPWLRGFGAITSAERFNQERFEDSLNSQANKIKHGDKTTFKDYWHRKLTAGVTDELYYASGTSTIKSTGTFDLSCVENMVSIGGVVQHHWYDPYDWHAGLTAYIPGAGDISDADALVMQNCRGAKPFEMEADWTQSLSATITVGKVWNDKSFTWSGP